MVADEGAVPTIAVYPGPQQPDAIGGSGNSAEIGRRGAGRLAVSHDADDVRRRSAPGTCFRHHLHLVRTAGLKTFQRVRRAVRR